MRSLVLCLALLLLPTAAWAYPDQCKRVFGAGGSAEVCIQGSVWGTNVLADATTTTKTLTFTPWSAGFPACFTPDQSNLFYDGDGNILYACENGVLSALTTQAKWDTSAEIRANVGDTSGTGKLLFADSSLLTGLTDVEIFQAREFIAVLANDNYGPGECTSGLYYLYADTSEARWKKCQNGTLTDLGSPFVEPFVITGSVEFKAGHLVTKGTAPVVTGCGTIASQIGNDKAGRFTSGTGAITTCTVTFAQAYTTNAPVCVLQNVTLGTTLLATESTTAFTFAGAVSTTYKYLCEGIE